MENLEALTASIQIITDEITTVSEDIDLINNIFDEFTSEKDWRKAKQQQINNSDEGSIWRRRRRYMMLTLNQIMKEKQKLSVRREQLSVDRQQLREKEIILLRQAMATGKDIMSKNNIESQFCIEFSRIDVAASSLKDSDHLALLWRPIHLKNYRFLGNNSLNKMYDFYESHLRDSDQTECLDELLSKMKFPPSYKISSCSETTFNMNNLKAILHFISSRLTPPGLFTPLNRTETSFKCYFASKKSTTEEVIVTNIKNIQIPLVVSETKGVDANSFKAMPQAVQCGGDVLLHNVKRIGFPIEIALVPFIIVSGECVQIGTVYSLYNETNDFYPVPVLLTKPINFLNVGNELIEIIPWLKAIVDHCNYQINEVIRLNTIRSPSRRASDDEKLVRLNCQNLFFKPIQLFVSDEPEFNLYPRNIRLLQIFERLWNNPKAQKFVVFPIGFMGYPNKDNNIEECSQVDKLIPKELWRASTHTSHEVGAVCSGHPIIIYPNIEREGWIRSVQTKEEGGKIMIPSNKIDKFLKLLEEAYQSFEEAKVCHLDIRLTNIFFKENNETNELFIKIVDWDYSQFYGYYLENGFKDICKNSAHFPSHIQYADNNWHYFMFEYLRDLLL